MKTQTGKKNKPINEEMMNGAGSDSALPSKFVMSNVQELEQELKETLTSLPNSAKVTLKVTKFIPAPKFSQCNMRMSESHPRVRVVGRGKLAKLKITNGDGPVIISFRIVGPTKKEAYFPRGIAFVRLDPKGLPVAAGNRASEDDSFPLDRMHVIGDLLYITDIFINDPQILRYKFSVFFQRASDGALGLIDPPAENENGQ